MLYKLLNTDNSYASVFLRLALAFVILPMGYLKITDFSKIIEVLESHYRLPFSIALMVIIIEFFSPLLLIIGAFARLNAILIGIVMVGAMFYHIEHGFFINWFGNQAGEGYQFHLLAIGAAIALTISGGGKWTLDTLIQEKLNSNK